MAKMIRFIKSNLQGLFIAALIVSFLSETYFFTNNGFILTEVLFYITIIAFAVIQHFEDNKDDINPSGNEKKISLRNIFTSVDSYLKNGNESKLWWAALLIVLIVAACFGYLKAAAILFIVIYYPKRRSYIAESNSARAKKLKAKGLTRQDIVNIEFVKKWDETRKDGLWKYCIKDGGIIAGALFSLLNTMIFFFITHKSILQMFPGPGDMFRFIGYAYLSGIVVGIIVYRFLWIINERRFLRLTDPLNTLFSGKEASFNDLI